jgi:hypothetical protein
VHAPGKAGAAAAIRYWWFRYEPPKAAWKKWSAITYFGAPFECRYS